MIDEKEYFIPDSEYHSDPSQAGSHSVMSRNSIREQLQSQVEEFLAKGGMIAQLPPNARSVLPQRPEADVGGFE